METKMRNSRGSSALSFMDCQRLYTAARFKHTGKPVARNTWVVKIDDDTYGIKLHSTIVVRVHRSGIKTVYSGGWVTNTTRDRINTQGGLNLWSHKCQWYSKDTNGLSSRVEDGSQFDCGLLIVPALDQDLIIVARHLMPGHVRFEPALSEWLRKKYVVAEKMSPDERYLIVADAKIAA